MLAIINAIIIVVAELSGKFFYNTGLIHFCAIAFIGLAASRLFIHYHIYDHVLEKFLHANIVVLFVWATSHTVEFFSTVIFKLDRELISVSVITIYITGLFIVAFGAESFLRIYSGRSKMSWTLLFLGAAVSLLMIVVFIYQPDFLSLETNSLIPYIYTLILILVAYVSLSRIIQIKKIVSIVKDLAGSLMLSYILIIIVAAVEIHYDLFQRLGMEIYQITYLAHFIFFAALSISFLSFAKVKKLGGVYADVEKINGGGVASK